jgi:hypothetical protein
LHRPRAVAGFLQADRSFRFAVPRAPALHRGEPSPGADVVGAGPVLVQTWQGRALPGRQSPVTCRRLQVYCVGQTIGIVVAESAGLAREAARCVKKPALGGCTPGLCAESAGLHGSNQRVGDLGLHFS